METYRVSYQIPPGFEEAWRCRGKAGFIGRCDQYDRRTGGCNLLESDNGIISADSVEEVLNSFEPYKSCAAWVKRDLVIDGMDPNPETLHKVVAEGSDGSQLFTAYFSGGELFAFAPYDLSHEDDIRKIIRAYKRYGWKMTHLPDDLTVVEHFPIYYIHL